MNEIAATRTLPRDHPALEGHFPGHPIFPGAFLLDEIRELIMERWERDIVEFRNAKFHEECPPGASLRIEITDAGQRYIRFTAHFDGGLVVSGEARLAPAQS